MSKKETKELSSASDFIKSYATKEMTLEDPKRVIEIQTLPIEDFRRFTWIESETNQLLFRARTIRNAIISPLVSQPLTKEEYRILTDEELRIREHEVFKKVNKFSDTDIKQIYAEVIQFSTETHDKAAEI